MNKRELSQVGSLNKEIALLKRQLEDAEYQVNPNTVTDTVKGSSKYFPYNERVFSITGVDYTGYDRKVSKLKKQLQSRIDVLVDKVTEANEYIASIEDSETRMILQCRYINNLTWEQLEAETGINERTARRKYKYWYEFG